MASKKQEGATREIEISKLEVNRGQLYGLPKNPRFIRDERFEALKKSIRDDPEMLSLRELIVYPLESGNFLVIGGNMRLRACEELGYEALPCKVLPVETPVAKLRAYVVKDNVAFGENDWDAFANEWDLDELKAMGLELDGIEDGQEEKPEVMEDDFDEDEAEPRCKRGEIWKLGEHRLMCGDSTDAADVAKLMDGKKADLVFTDPPYGMKKEREGIENDNLNFDDLLNFNREWIPLSFCNLKENGSWYCWGMDEPLMDIYGQILKPMAKRNEITFRNLITWDKDSAFGRCSGEMRVFPPSDEKCLFVMCGLQCFNTNAENYFEGWEPVRRYLEAEAEKVGLDAKKLKEICGVGMYSHWFGKSQWEFIPENRYKELQAYYGSKGFKREYEGFKREYEEIKREYCAKRAFFDNTHDNMTNVWHFQRTSGEERKQTGGHATPKPIALCARAVKSSSREGEIVLDLFGGSGSTLIACEQLGRKCFMMELSAKYCDVIISRWEQLTGKTAEKVA